MKRLLVILLLLCMCGSACADVETGLSGFSFDELLTLQRLLSLEAMKRPEWKETIVPSGTWVVGIDIPSKAYSIFPTEYGGYLKITRNGSLIVFQSIRSDDKAFWKIDLLENDVVEVSSGSLIFAPPKGLDF